MCRAVAVPSGQRGTAFLGGIFVAKADDLRQSDTHAISSCIKETKFSYFSILLTIVSENFRKLRVSNSVSSPSKQNYKLTDGSAANKIVVLVLIKMCMSLYYTNLTKVIF